MKKVDISNTFNKNGFTLIESLIAILLLGSVVAFLISTMSNRFSDILKIRDNIIAEYLAQEGLEAIRNIRDSVAIQNNSETPEAQFAIFQSQVAACDLSLNRFCNVNPITLSLTTCTPATCTLENDPTSGFWGNNSIPGAQSGVFLRYITVSFVNPAGPAKVRVVVENKRATSGTTAKQTITAEEELYPWQ